MEPQQQVPQQPTNRSFAPNGSSGNSSNTMKIVAVIIVLIVIGLIVFFLTRTKPAETPGDQAAVENADTELTQLEQENNSQDFSSVDADFGAEVNSAVQ